MSVRRLCPEQPPSFAFNAQNLAWARELIPNYPEGQEQSAVIPLLWRAQEQNDGWLCEPAIRLVADMLGMAYIRVYEVATFYTMYQLSPVGRKAHVQVCGTTPCMLRGSGDLIKVCKSRIAENAHELSEEGDFSWEEVECLGVCANAPMVQIWKDTYEDLTAELFETVLDGYAAGKPPNSGSQIGRTASCPEGGATTLLDPSLYDGSGAAARNANLQRGAAKAGADAGVVVAERRVEAAVPDAAKPDALKGPRDGKADDLKRIIGVGPKLEETLNGLGVFHFDQIAAWTDDTVDWVDTYLSFKGRITREDWIAQAKAFLRSGGHG